MGQAEISSWLTGGKRRGGETLADELQADGTREIEGDRGGIGGIAGLFEFDVVRVAIAVAVGEQRVGGGFRTIG